MEELIRESLRNVEAYSSARSLGLEAQIFLDANELSLGSAATFEGKNLHRYPPPQCPQLRQGLSQWSGVAEKNIFLCAGSDQGIELLIRLFCEPFRDEVAILEPTYGMYKTCAEIQGVGVRRLALNEKFDFCAAEILPQIQGVKILFLCSPNNPTGNLLNGKEIFSLLENFKGLLVIDQAYLEFCAEKAGADWSRQIAHFKQLIVLRTFSKAWGLAAIRLGYVIADPSVIKALHKVMPPYPVSSLTSVIAQRALAASGFLVNAVRCVQQERDHLVRELSQISVVQEIFPSEANFLLLRCRDRERIFLGLLARGLCVRRRGEASLADTLRITIGTPQENTQLLQAFKELI